MWRSPWHLVLPERSSEAVGRRSACCRPGCARWRSGGDGGSASGHECDATAEHGRRSAVVWELDGYAAGPEVGRDAAGTAVLARDEATGTDVAIRFLSTALCASNEFMWRFRADVAQ